VPRANSGEVPTSPSLDLVNVHLGRKTVQPSEPENKLVEYCIIMDQSYYGLRRQDINKMHGISVGNKKFLKQPFNKENSEAGKK
jgi:hypothetical protein